MLCKLFVCVTVYIFSPSRGFAFQRDLQHSGFQGDRGQSLPVLSHHRQNPGGGAFHLSSGPLQPHHTEERQQGADLFVIVGKNAFSHTLYLKRGGSHCDVTV